MYRQLFRPIFLRYEVESYALSVRFILISVSFSETPFCSFWMSGAA